MKNQKKTHQPDFPLPPLLVIDKGEVEQLLRCKPFVAIVQKLNKDISDCLILDFLDKHGLQHTNLSLSGKTSTSPHLIKESKDDIRASFEEFLTKGISPVIIIHSGFRAFKRLDRKIRNSQLIDALQEIAYPIIPISVFIGHGDKGQTTDVITIRIGKQITPLEKNTFLSHVEFRQYLLSKLYALVSANRVKKIYSDEGANELRAAVIDRVDVEELKADLDKLTYEHLISTRYNFDVFVAPAQKIPNILREIGRLRELTFREVGEGTGLSTDLDEYDQYYKQLFIWDKINECIVGGYRLGEGDIIFHERGVAGFYINRFFKINKGFYPIMKHSIELGRSFVVKGYQKDRLPLFLLWKGILYFLINNPQYRYLYGPMSISKYYSHISKSIIVEFVKRNYFDHEVAKFLKPKKPFQVDTENIAIKSLLDNFGNNLASLDSFIEDIEPRHFKIPILLKQYVRQKCTIYQFQHRS